MSHSDQARAIITYHRTITDHFKLERRRDISWVVLAAALFILTLGFNHQISQLEENQQRLTVYLALSTGMCEPHLPLEPKEKAL